MPPTPPRPHPRDGTLRGRAKLVSPRWVEAGVFAAGGILVDSFAFHILGNLLGVRWPGAAWRTQDVDVAGHLQVAIPAMDADVPAALDSLQMGFIPVPELDSRQPSTSFRVRGKELRVDLITPGGERDVKPIYIPRFKAAAAPIKFLSLLMRESQPAAAVNGAAVCLVVVPTPARFALHKLLVGQTRSVVQQTKGGKDLHQAALLLEVLAEDRPDDLEQVAAAGRCWRIEHRSARWANQTRTCGRFARLEVRATLADSG